MIKFEDLIGKVLVRIDGKLGDDIMVFEDSEGITYSLYHSQDCCEYCYIADIVGDLKDLIGVPILMAEEVTYVGENPNDVEIPIYQDSFTWTFYKLATINGFVTIRWYGESNGWYSERVDFDIL